MAEGDERIDARCTAGGDVASGERDCGEADADDEVGDGIERAESEKQS